MFYTIRPHFTILISYYRLMLYVRNLIHPLDRQIAPHKSELILSSLVADPLRQEQVSDVGSYNYHNNFSSLEFVFSCLAVSYVTFRYYPMAPGQDKQIRDHPQDQEGHAQWSSHKV